MSDPALDGHRFLRDSQRDGVRVERSLAEGRGGSAAVRGGGEAVRAMSMSVQD